MNLCQSKRCRWMSPLLLLGLMLTTGCEEPRVVSTSWGKYDNAPPPPPTARDAITEVQDTWAIALSRCDGPNHQQTAQQQRSGLASRTGLTDIWVADEGNCSLVYYGHYASPRDQRAKEDLSRWQQLVAAGRVQLPALMLVPILSPSGGTEAQYALSTARSRGRYTLQVGFYEGKGREKAAQEWVAELHQQKEDAYYHHGPNRSMVTIGVFSEADVGQPTISADGKPSYGPKVEELRRRFQHNLGNGVTVRIKKPDGTTHDDPSFIVSIPGSDNSQVRKP